MYMSCAQCACRFLGVEELHLIMQASGVTRYTCMNRSDGSEGIIEIKHNTDPDRVDRDTWLVVRKRLTNASQVGSSKHTKPSHSIRNSAVQSRGGGHRSCSCLSSGS